jgi:Fe2+ or Zn2+ uptake regulation protein
MRRLIANGLQLDEAGEPDMIRPTQRRPLLDVLGSKGVRITAQRRALVEVIQHAAKHLDADDLFELARKRQPTINRATVYRTIGLLKEFRLYRRARSYASGGREALLRSHNQARTHSLGLLPVRPN